MKTATTTACRVLPVLLAPIVVAVVLGILGMHALNIHGAMSGSTQHADATYGTSPSATGSDASAMSGVAGMSGMTGMSDLRPAGAHDGPASVHSGYALSAPNGDDGGHDMGAMVMLCVAMLAAAGLTILATLALRRTTRQWISLPAAPTTPHRFAFPRLGTGPPPAWEYSVIRC